MSATYLTAINHFYLDSDAPPKPFVGARLLKWITANRQRAADRQILAVLPTLPDTYRTEFVVELERRLLGQ